MDDTATRQVPCVSTPRHYAWAVQLNPVAPRYVAECSTLELMFFGGEPVFHIVRYEEHRRTQLERRGGALCIVPAQRRRSLVSPGSVASLDARAADTQELLLSAA